MTKYMGKKNNVYWISVLKEMSASKVNASLGGNGTAASSRSTSKREVLQLEERDTSDENGWEAVRIDSVDNATTATTSKDAMDNSVIDQPLLNVVNLVHGPGMVSSMPGIEDLVDSLQYDGQATLSTETDLLNFLSLKEFTDKFSKLISSTTPSLLQITSIKGEVAKSRRSSKNLAHGCSKLFEQMSRFGSTCCIVSQPRWQITNQLRNIWRQSSRRVSYARCAGSDTRRRALFKSTSGVMTCHGCLNSAILLAVSPRLTGKSKIAGRLTRSVRMGVVRRYIVLSKTTNTHSTRSCFPVGTHSNSTLAAWNQGNDTTDYLLPS